MSAAGDGASSSPDASGLGGGAGPRVTSSLSGSVAQASVRPPLRLCCAAILIFGPTSPGAVGAAPTSATVADGVLLRFRASSPEMISKRTPRGLTSSSGPSSRSSSGGGPASGSARRTCDLDAEAPRANNTSSRPAATAPSGTAEKFPELLEAGGAFEGWEARSCRCRGDVANTLRKRSRFVDNRRTAAEAGRGRVSRKPGVRGEVLPAAVPFPPIPAAGSCRCMCL